APDQLYRTATELLGDPSVQSVLGWVQGVIGTFAAQAYNLFLALIFVFFLVRDEHRLAGWVRAHVVGEDTATDGYLSTARESRPEAAGRGAGVNRVSCVSVLCNRRPHADGWPD